MFLQDIVTLRHDLLFNGAVPLSWFEENPTMACKAAQHFIFHGPAENISERVDTASFTAELVERLVGGSGEDPFMLAVAGYGTGKSQLALTLSLLLSAPDTPLAREIVRHIEAADVTAAARVREQLAGLQKPYLVVAINGMRDFDLGQEIIRQVMAALSRSGLDISVLEDLRPRFKTAIKFVRAFFSHLQQDFASRFGNGFSVDEIADLLKAQDEAAFRKVNEIYEQKMGAPIHTVGQESLPEFIRVVKEHYCGPGHPYAGLLIMFDEFGRYLEFAVQKPHIAGPGALQQLFEAVQANGERVFLLLFMQNDLRAYISRVAPELRDELDRYVSRYDMITHFRLSSNLEALIASLLEKKNQAELERRLKVNWPLFEECWRLLQKVLPAKDKHLLWNNREAFDQVVCRGCWPLHPLSTWLLYRLASDKILQQRSAVSILAAVYDQWERKEWPDGGLLRPVDMLGEALLSEFQAYERQGERGSATQAYQEVMHKYQHRFTDGESSALKAVLLTTRLGLKSDNWEDYSAVLAQCIGFSVHELQAALHTLEREYGVLSRNAALHQYDIVADAVPRQAFLDYLARKVLMIEANRRAEIFVRQLGRWLNKKEYRVDFAAEQNIATPDFNYQGSLTNVRLLPGQLQYAFSSWQEALAVDQFKGQLIYCYVGPESDLELVREDARRQLAALLDGMGAAGRYGAPLAVVFLPDSQGELGRLLAEFWVLQEELSQEDRIRFSRFIQERKDSLIQELSECFDRLVGSRQYLLAAEVGESSLSDMLSSLFAAVYPDRIPFPFDGFSTARGNAAADCHLFTRELFLGSLSVDWIAAQAVKTKNRAVTLFDKSWGALDGSGQVRLEPANPAVRRLFKVLDKWLDGNYEHLTVESGFDSTARPDVDLQQHATQAGPDDLDAGATTRPLNLGWVIQVLCTPPFGLNIASAGLVLGLYFARRRSNLQLLYRGRPMNVQDWLSEAFSGKFLNITVLNDTSWCRLSQEDVSEWERLLNEWELAEALDDILRCENQAIKLERESHLPAELYYKFKLLRQKTASYKVKLTSFENDLNKALERVEHGREHRDVSLLSWGAAELAGLYNRVNSEQRFWGQHRRVEVTTHYAAARLQVQQLFPAWLRGQSASSEAQLMDFKRKMKLVKQNLEAIDLDEEKAQLAEHVRQVEENVQSLAAIKRVGDDVRRLTQNTINDEVTVATLRGWLDQVRDLAGRLEQAQSRATIARHEIAENRRELATFQEKCQAQLDRVKERAEKIYEFSVLTSPVDLFNLVQEVARLRHLFNGYPKDLEDLELVQRQVDVMTAHYRRLERENEQLDDAALQEMWQSLLHEAEDAFAGDVPPLDGEAVYGSMLQLIKEERARRATDWLARHLPDTTVVNTWSAEECARALKVLRDYPAYLTAEQREQVHAAGRLLQQRLDDLAVEGLWARFLAMPSHQQSAFLQRLHQFLLDLTRFGGHPDTWGKPLKGDDHHAEDKPPVPTGVPGGSRPPGARERQENGGSGPGSGSMCDVKSRN